jgi:hypothetical protein
MKKNWLMRTCTVWMMPLTMLLLGEIAGLGCAQTQSRLEQVTPVVSPAIARQKLTTPKFESESVSYSTQPIDWDSRFNSTGPQEMFSVQKWFFESFKPALTAIAVALILISGFLLGQYFERHFSRSEEGNGYLRKK